MRKLIVIPGFGGIGGTTVSLSLMIKGFEQCGASEHLCVVIASGTEEEQYLRQAGQASYLKLISAKKQHHFNLRALRWASQQPQNWPLLLQNWTASKVLPALAMMTPILKLSGRPLYHSFHDPGYSKQALANLARKLIWSSLAPVTICNSRFTSQYICPRLLPDVKDILYPAVDTEKFQGLSINPPPEPLKPILNSGARIMLTPTRISEPYHFNDKNIRGLLPVLAELKALGHYYHGVVIGRDYSANQSNTQVLLEQAQSLGVADRFSVLPVTYSINDYYNYADVVVTLAPREPFGRTVVEAVAHGIPVIGSRTGGIGEVLSNFAPEWMVDPFDPIAAAQAIIHVSTDPETSQLLTQGRCWIEEQCSPEKYARKIIEITELNPPNLFHHESNSKKAVAI